MKKSIFILIILLCNQFYAQQKKIVFAYDAAGNQIKREYCPACSAKTSNELVKNIEDLKESDLKKFHPMDEISYYPNPVKEQLYIKWINTNDAKVSSIKLYDISGRIIKSYPNLTKIDSFTIQFDQLPQNLYNVVLIYSNGEDKSIKIIKN